MTEEEYIDITSEQFCFDPYPIYDRFRKKGNIHHMPNLNMYMVLSFDEVKSILGDHESFSSKITESFDPVLLGADQPYHTRNRNALKGDSGPFNRFRIDKLADRIRHHCKANITKAADMNAVDIINDIASPLASIVAMEYMGFDLSGSEEMMEWTNVAISNASVYDPDFAAKHWEKLKITITNFYDKQDEKKGAGVLHELYEWAKSDPNGFTLEEIVAVTKTLLVGGHETTPNLIGNALYYLLIDDELRAMARQSDKALNMVIYETLRHSAPTQLVHRVSTKAVNILGMDLAENTQFAVSVGAAMRDPAKYPNANKFDITRKKSSIIPFGSGIHYCLGAHLAMLEAQIALRMMLDDLPQLTNPKILNAERKKASHIFGFEKLEISL